MKKIKLPKEFWEKGKSKFLELRPELQNKKINIDIGLKEKIKQQESVIANIKRRLIKYGKA